MTVPADPQRPPDVAPPSRVAQACGASLPCGVGVALAFGAGLPAGNGVAQACGVAVSTGDGRSTWARIDFAIHDAEACPGHAAHSISGSFP